MAEPPSRDIFETWAAEIRQLAAERTEFARQAIAYKRKHDQQAENIYFYAEQAQTQEKTVQRLSGALGSVRSRLERLHVPKCRGTGAVDCAACEALDDLDAL